MKESKGVMQPDPDRVTLGWGGVGGPWGSLGVLWRPGSVSDYGCVFPGGVLAGGGVPWGPKCGFPRISWWWVFALEVCMGGLGGASRGAGGLWGPPCGGIFF